ncbi:MAG TPA: hypothetical protein GX690_01790 [Tenericutes bacterium]|nr:hypothetical protein [Mycoplasmatota bacterium]
MKDFTDIPSNEPEKDFDENTEKEMNMNYSFSPSSESGGDDQINSSESNSEDAGQDKKQKSALSNVFPKVKPIFLVVGSVGILAVTALFASAIVTMLGPVPLIVFGAIGGILMAKSETLSKLVGSVIKYAIIKPIKNIVTTLGKGLKLGYDNIKKLINNLRTKYNERKPQREARKEARKQKKEERKRQRAAKKEARKQKIDEFIAKMQAAIAIFKIKKEENIQITINEQEKEQSKEKNPDLEKPKEPKKQKPRSYKPKEYIPKGYEGLDYRSAKDTNENSVIIRTIFRDGRYTISYQSIIFDPENPERKIYSKPIIYQATQYDDNGGIITYGSFNYKKLNREQENSFFALTKDGTDKFIEIVKRDPTFSFNIPKLDRDAKVLNIAPEKKGPNLDLDKDIKL